VANEYDPYFRYMSGETGPLDPHAAYMRSLDTRASGPRAASAASPATGAIVGAGIGAAGQTIGTIAQIMGQSAARQSALEQAGLGRESDSRLAKLRIQAATELADKERAMQAQQFLIQALGLGTSNAIRAWDSNRSANQAGSSLIAQAFM